MMSNSGARDVRNDRLKHVLKLIGVRQKPGLAQGQSF